MSTHASIPRTPWSLSRIAAISLIHLGALAAPWYFSWSALVVLIISAFVCGCLGITVGYHRLLTHRSFKCPTWLEYTLATIGTLNWQGGPIKWVGTHRIHHAESDMPKDPHSPHHGGFWWSHIVWVLRGDSFAAREAAGDLQKDSFMKILDTYFWIPLVLFGVMLIVLGNLVDSGLGWSWFVYAVPVRMFLAYHLTWFVNSASHLWGYKNFKTGDESRNNWWVALLSWGEGWHNNHHAFQRSAAHGLRWWEIDITYLVIRTLVFFGLAWDVVLPEQEIPHTERSWIKKTIEKAVPVSSTNESFWIRLLRLLALA